MEWEFKKALKEKGIDDILDEARESNRENDREHMKRTCELFSRRSSSVGDGDADEPRISVGAVA